MKLYDMIIIGGGPAGMMAAGTAAELRDAFEFANLSNTLLLLR